MRKLRFFGDDAEFTLLELTEEIDCTDEEFDAIANLQEGESVEIDELGRIERVKEVEVKPVIDVNA